MTTARELTSRLADLLRNEHAALADFLVALAAFDRCRTWEQLGYTSLFWFLHRELGLSKSAAFYRKTAAELVHDYPEVLESLRAGRLCLTSLAELAKVITPENQAEVLPRFFTLSAREAKEVTAALLPAEAPPLRAVVTAVPSPSPALTLSIPPAPATATLVPPSRGSAPNLPHANSRVPDVSSAPAVTANRPAVEVEPLTSELRRLHITVTRRLLAKLDAARDALSHSHPGAGRDEILEAGLNLLLERAAKRRGLVKNPRKRPLSSKPAPPASAPPSARGGRSVRNVPAEIRRAIWERDQGMCQWPLDGGGICGSTHQVELDHIEPFAKGGRITTAADGRLLCRVHQDVSARREFGDARMDRFTRRRRRGTS